MWNIRYFSRIGQSLSNKNEATHAYWKRKFWRYFTTQIKYNDWPNIQIILLSNKNLSRCKSLLKMKKKNDALYKDIDFVWVKRMKKCLQSMTNLIDLKLFPKNGYSKILNLSSSDLNQECYLNFDPSSCFKYIQRIKSNDEEQILFYIGQYLMMKKKEKKSMNGTNMERVDIALNINNEFVNNIKKELKIKYNNELIINLLQRTFKCIDNLDGNDEQETDSDAEYESQYYDESDTDSYCTDASTDHSEAE